MRKIELRMNEKQEYQIIKEIIDHKSKKMCDPQTWVVIKTNQSFNHDV